MCIRDSHDRNRERPLTTRLFLPLILVFGLITCERCGDMGCRVVITVGSEGVVADSHWLNAAKHTRGRYRKGFDIKLRARTLQCVDHID